MQALTFHGPEAVRYEAVPEPAIEQPADALLRITATAICGSDLHVYHGRETGLDAGTVMGHEFAGEVIEVGSDVHTLAPGTRVAGPFSTNCGDCFYCRRGLTCRCPSGELFGWVESGRGLHGTQAEYLRVPLADATLVAVPDDVSDAEALLLGDVLSTGFFCADMAGVEADGVYAVLGCGPVGLMAVLAARERGANTVLAVDSVGERLALAERFGAIPVDFSQVDPVVAVGERTDGRGVDAVLEAVGSSAATRLAIDLVRPGGTIAAAGVHNEANFAFRPIEVYDKNLTYRSGRCPARAYMNDLLPVVQRRHEDLAGLFTHQLPLADGAAAYEMFAARRDGCIKVLLAP